MPRTVRTCCFIGVALLFAGCDRGSDLPTGAIDGRVAEAGQNGGQPNIITVTPASTGLAIGQTVQLVAVVANRHGVVQPDRPVAFASSNPAVASVSASGLVTAVADGSAEILASSGGAKPITATAHVSVGPANLMSISPFFGGFTTSGGVALFQVVGDYPNVSIVCRINGAETSCDQPLTWADLGLVTGDALTIEVTASTLNVSPPAAGPTATLRAIIDDQGPSIEILAPADGLRVGGRVELRFSTDDPEAVFTCTLDGAVPECVPGSTILLELFVSGPHFLTVTGTDALGNSTRQDVAFVVDLRGPVFDAGALRVPAGPVGFTSTPETEILFRAFDSPPFSASPISYRCSLDGAVVACSATPDHGGAFRWTGLSDGLHLLTVIAFDDFGNASEPLEVTFEVERP